MISSSSSNKWVKRLVEKLCWYEKISWCLIGRSEDALTKEEMKSDLIMQNIFFDQLIMQNIDSVNSIDVSTINMFITLRIIVQCLFIGEQDFTLSITFWYYDTWLKIEWCFRVNLKKYGTNMVCMVSHMVYKLLAIIHLLNFEKLPILSIIIFRS